MRQINVISKSSNAQLTKNLNAQEIKCRCRNVDCQDSKFTDECLDSFQKTRDGFGSGIGISSGNRCQKYNQLKGGSKKSNHMYGDSLDMFPHNGDLKGLIKECRKHWKFVLPYIEEGFVHCDNRLNKEI